MGLFLNASCPGEGAALCWFVGGVVGFVGEGFVGEAGGL